MIIVLLHVLVHKNGEK